MQGLKQGWNGSKTERKKLKRGPQPSPPPRQFHLSSIPLFQAKLNTGPDQTRTVFLPPGKRLEAGVGRRRRGGCSGRGRPDRPHVGSSGRQALHRQVPRVSGGEPGPDGRRHRVFTLTLRGVLLQVPFGRRRVRQVNVEQRALFTR